MQFTLNGIKAAYANAQPPKEVHQSFLAGLAYLAVGLLYSLVSIIFSATLLSSVGGFGGVGIGSAVFGLVFSLIIYALALFVLIQMRAGRNWARITITVLGGIAVLFGIIGIFGMLFAFGVLSALVGVVYPLVNSLFYVVQMALLAFMILLMWRPSAKTYFH